MSRDFDELMKEIEDEARHAGPKAMAQYAAAGATHRLARQVFDLRKAAWLTQRQLAAASGVQQADMSRIEAGDANPTLATIAALAYALGAQVTLAPAKAVGQAQRKGQRVSVRRGNTKRRRLATAARQVSVRRAGRHITGTR